MADILTEVRRWRAKADELRAAAENLMNAIARDSLLEMADGYEKLARHAEGLAARRPAGPA